MPNSFGNNFKLTIFGASHAPDIGMELTGIPAGKAVDLPGLQAFLNRRAPGQSPLSTQRKEADIPQFLSGIVHGATNGDAIRAVIYNENIHRSDYDPLRRIPRPGHADYTAWVKYGADFDMSGGGPFSGRMTAPMCIAGGLCKQWLEEMGISIRATIVQIGNVSMLADGTAEEDLYAQIAAAKERGDSVGGKIRCTATGVPAGFGGELFSGVESHVSSILFSIPGVKAVGFGDGEGFASMPGSIANDPFLVENGRIITETNHCGGILGGITNGMPIVFDVTLKPTPSISLPQKSVDLTTMEEVTMQVGGRHDPCIVPRAVPVVEAAAAIALYDLILGGI